jgi:uroporphyrinogen-III synthase
MTKILATKKLTKKQKTVLSDANIGIETCNFIKIKRLSFQLNTIHDFLIFSSKNAVKSILKANKKMFSEKKCFCVGSKTKKILEKNGFVVVASAANAIELISIIDKQFPSCSATFFCGNRRKDTITDYFISNNLVFNEVIVYETLFHPKKIAGVFDGILFFSPSAIISYSKFNTLTTEICFCIGATTKDALLCDQKNTCVLPNEPTIEAVLNAVIDFYKPKFSSN